MPFSACQPLKFTGSVGLDSGSPAASAKAAVTPAAGSAEQPAQLRFSSTAADITAQVSLTVAAWPLDMGAKYVGQFLLPALAGQLDA